MEKKEKKRLYCAIYTRKSTSEGLDQDFTTLDAQREAGENYIASQKSEGWVPLQEQYNDGGFTGANIERPALQKLLSDIKEHKIDCVVVYKVDRLSRSLMDFAQLLKFFEEHNVTFVSVTQHFNTNSSMGRLTLNILLSFAQFEREIIIMYNKIKKIKIKSRRPMSKIDTHMRGNLIIRGNADDTKICFNCGEVSKLKNGKLEAIDIKDFPKETKTLIERTNILLEYARNEK